MLLATLSDQARTLAEDLGTLGTEVETLAGRLGRSEMNARAVLGIETRAKDLLRRVGRWTTTARAGLAGSVAKEREEEPCPSGA